MYLEAFQNHTPLTAISNIIQKRELEEHLKRNNCLENNNNQQECLKWIESNGANFRGYINSLVDFAIYMKLDIILHFRTGLVYEIFVPAVKVWNSQIDTLNYIRLDEKL